MFQIATYESFHDGQVIYEEGTHGDWIYVIEEGSVEISRRIDNQKIVVVVLNQGEIFGEVSYISKVSRTATAVAIGETTVGIIDRSFFDQEYNKLSGNFHMILNTLALRLKKTTDVIVDILAKQS